MVKRKTKQLFKNTGIILLIVLIVGFFIGLMMLDDQKEASKVPKINEIFKTTNAYKYAIENNTTISSITFIDSLSIDNFLRKRGYSTACPYITFNDFAFIYGKRFVVAINTETFEVECDWVRDEKK